MDVSKRKGIKSVNKEEAWNRFVNGDKKFFEYVFRGYFNSMNGYGIKLCNRPEVVKDCIHELFKNIWERRNELIHVKSPNVYLFVSLRRKILRKVKSQRRLNGDLDEIDEGYSIQFGQDEIIIKDEEKFQQKKKLKQALNQLSNRQKEVIYLHYYNGMSYGEIEQILSINRQSVRNYIYRGMENLRSSLDKEIMKLVGSLLISFLLL